MNKVIQWDLEVKFKTKAQQAAFVGWLMTQEIEYTFDVWNHFTDRYEYYVKIIEMPWANNLTLVGEFLKTIDHEMT
jgi:hypothetical protein